MPFAVVIVGLSVAASDERGIGSGLRAVDEAPRLPPVIEDERSDSDDDADESCEADCVGDGGDQVWLLLKNRHFGCL